MAKKIDLTGKQFGYWTVMYEIPERRIFGGKKKILWHCKCKCGNEKDVIGDDLRSGHSTSCGCKKKEIIGNLNKLDLTNQKFNYLTALKPTNRRSGHCIVWKCKCDCGNITYVSSNDLRQGNTKSCGCLKSQGEKEIGLLLQKEKIRFQKQYSIIINSITYYYDFAILNTDNKIEYLIEYDGIQHFQTKTGGWNNEENLKRTQKRDYIKNNWCIKNNIPLIRIPYTHLKKITIDDLLLNKSKFIYKEG